MNNKYTNSPLSDYVRRWCIQHDISLERLARQAGIARGTLYHLLDPQNTPKIPHLLKLAHAMQVHHTVLFRLKWSELGVIDESYHPVLVNPVRQGGDASGFIDETIPDGSIIAAGSTFTKSWTLQNVGDILWENRYLVCIDYKPMIDHYPNGQPIQDYQLRPHQNTIAIPPTPPGHIVTLKMDFDAPRVTGRYISYWKMIDSEGNVCFPKGIGVSVSILVHSFGVSY